MFISEDFAQFKTLFVYQLKNMLSPDELGAFILVLANSQQNKFLQNELAVELENTFQVLKKKFLSGELNSTKDDSDVFKKIVDLELSEITCWQYRELKNWSVVYNSMRKLRPARASNEVLTSIYKKFDETKFHFNKPFLKPEILWQDDCNFNNKKKTIRVLYNKFPFSNYHLLLAISPEKNLPQFLTQEMHEFVMSMVSETAKVFPGFSVGFNSLAAGASVNHLHFQGFIRDEIYPIETPNWRHNGGDEDYPVEVKRFSNDAWSYIERLAEQEIAFNCVYRMGACYVIPRPYRDVDKLPEWLRGAGWLDVAGVQTVSDEAVFKRLDDDAITNGLRELT